MDPRPSQRLMILDMEETRRAQLERIARQIPDHVLEVADSLDDALQLVTSQTYALIMIGDTVYTQDTTKILQTLLERQHGACLLVYGEHPTPQHAIDIMRAGAFHYLLPPLDQDRVLTILEQGLHHHQQYLQIAGLNQTVQQSHDLLQAQKAELEAQTQELERQKMDLESKTAKLQARVHELSTIYEVGQNLQASQRVNDTIALIIEMMLHTLRIELCGVLVIEQEGQTESLTIKFQHGQEEHRRIAVDPTVQMAMKWGSDREYTLESPVGAWLASVIGPDHPCQTFRVYGLEDGSDKLGYVVLGGYDNPTQDERFVSILVKQATGALERAIRYEALTAERDRLRQWNKDLNVLNDLSAEMAGTLDPPELARQVINQLQDVVPYQFVGIGWHRVGQEWIHMPKVASKEEEERWKKTLREYRQRDQAGVLDSLQGPHAPEEEDSARSLVLPMVVAQHRVGLIYLVRDTKQPPLSEYDRRLMATIAHSLGLSLRSAEVHIEMQDLATTDGLTGLLNRRAFDRRITDECRRIKRHQEPACLLMLDLDHFKSVNDRFGHVAGDQVLQQCADILKENSREVDSVARYGGEEFAVILPATALDQAQVVAARIQQAIREHRFDTGESKIAMTASLGLTQITVDHPQSVSDLIRAADLALYEAKARGRNRIEIAIPQGEAR